MLGGGGRKTLFLTTSQTGVGTIGAMAQELRETKMVKDPLGTAKGRIETVTLDVAGAGWP